MTRSRVLLNSGLSAVAVLSLLAATCPPTPTAVVHYKQVGACDGYDSVTGPAGPNSSATAGVAAAYVAFQITSIDNSTSGVDFNFDPERLFVSGTNDHVSTSITPALDFGSSKAVARTVPKGANHSNIGMAIVTVSTANVPVPSDEANKTVYTLEYETPPGSSIGVALTKDNLNQTTWPSTSDCLSLFRQFAPLFPTR